MSTLRDVRHVGMNSVVLALGRANQGTVHVREPTKLRASMSLQEMRAQKLCQYLLKAIQITLNLPVFPF